MKTKVDQSRRIVRIEVEELDPRQAMAIERFIKFLRRVKFIDPLSVEIVRNTMWTYRAKIVMLKIPRKL